MASAHEGATHHKSAAEHHEAAAAHHREATKHHESGDHEKAGTTPMWHRVMPRNVREESKNASKHHADTHGKKSSAKQACLSTCVWSVSDWAHEARKSSRAMFGCFSYCAAPGAPCDQSDAALTAPSSTPHRLCPARRLRKNGCFLKMRKYVGRDMMPCLAKPPSPTSIRHRPQMPRPPHTLSRSTPSIRAAASAVVPANRPRLPEGRTQQESPASLSRVRAVSLGASGLS